MGGHSSSSSNSAEVVDEVDGARETECGLFSGVVKGKTEGASARSGMLPAEGYVVAECEDEIVEGLTVGPERVANAVAEKVCGEAPIRSDPSSFDKQYSLLLGLRVALWVETDEVREELEA